MRTSCRPCDRFHTPAMERPGPWSRACTGPTVIIVRWYLRWFPITNLLYSDVDMCAGMLVHISRHLGKTSNNNNNKRCQLFILLYALPSLLPSDFILDFWFMIITILYMLTSCFTTYVLFHQSPALILSYHEYSLLDITCCIYLLLYAYAHDTIFNAYLWFGFIDTCVLIFTLLGISITTRRGVLTPLDSHVQSRSLELVDSPSWSPERCSGSMDHRKIVWNPILPGPYARL